MMSPMILAQPTYPIPPGTDGAGVFLPRQASTVAPAVDYLFYYINAVSIVFAFGCIALTFWWAWKYRAAKQPEPEPAGHNNVLEIVWSVIPAVLILVMFWFGFKGYMDMTVAPPAADRVVVKGKMWNWLFEYPNADGSLVGISDILYLPKGSPVALEMTSADVIHSLYIPAFRLKKDVVPGRYNKFWVQPTETGEFPVYCTEYCGTSHSKMLAKAVVLEPDEYRAKVRELADFRKSAGAYLSPPEIGKKLVALNGCGTCHNVSGAAGGTGPTWKNLYGEVQQVASGKNPVADYDYMLESIHYPQRQIALDEQGKPYTAAMSAYTNLSAEQIWYITEYMKTLSDKSAGEVVNDVVTEESIKSLQDRLKDVK
jgi:cytochrome c oxidase subunit II